MGEGASAVTPAESAEAEVEVSAAAAAAVVAAVPGAGVARVVTPTRPHTNKLRPEELTRNSRGPDPGRAQSKTTGLVWEAKAPHRSQNPGEILGKDSCL